MVAANLKSETTELMENRSAVENEMNAIIESLCYPGGPGLSGNLVDSEGFPRSDIDIHVVRTKRNRLAILRNDHREITEKIDENIQVLHSAKLTSKTPYPKDLGNETSSNQKSNSMVIPSASTSNVVQMNSPNAMDVDIIGNLPFAVVDQIADSAPTAEDGLQLGDQIVKFGSVEYQAGDNLLQKLATEAQANQDRAVCVTVLRQGAPIKLTLTPRTWNGRGLLGCSFRIL